MTKILSSWGMLYVLYNGVKYYPLSANSKFCFGFTVSVIPIYNQTSPKYVKVKQDSHWELWRKGRPYDS